MQELSAESGLILESFNVFKFLHRWYIQALQTARDVEYIRVLFYDLERLKGQIDRGLYNWRRDKDWRRKQEWQQEDNQLRPVHFALQRLMLEAQNAYRNFLQTHQNGAPASRVINP